ncbi:unnamed protein product [Meloidogyne enterolobii]|uniref:Uncharacterized protein n=1 Tax=Meloidogyne enterolobii TaxID=390850 RepID=A0ACB0YXS0_MELEN
MDLRNWQHSGPHTEKQQTSFGPDGATNTFWPSENVLVGHTKDHVLKQHHHQRLVKLCSSRWIFVPAIYGLWQKSSNLMARLMKFAASIF